ncbi:unnamed protein product [Strongylus vulgaris]|uniref:Uncharacterized protein n=1 Tax=Strongylus vulgaris TaxID=40348 RepID=A0A3P7M4I3_STRVU|nr:unnamed protein product [Strongylus vulgaris]
MQKLSPRRPLSTAEVRKPAGAFQQAGLIQEEDEEDKEEPIPIRPVSRTEASTPSGPKQISRNGGFHQSDISRITLPKEETNTSVPPTTLGRRVYTDIADNPNIIHPFPVPFLKKQSVVHQASRIKATTEETTASTERHTLPPSIVLAPLR